MGDEERAYNPATDPDRRQVPTERPVVPPSPDHTGRAPDGPKVAKFTEDDATDAEFEEAARAARRAGPSPAAGGEPRGGGKKDAVLQRFLDS